MADIDTFSRTSNGLATAVKKLRNACLIALATQAFSAVGQPIWPGHLLCTMSVGTADSAYRHFETQRWVISGGEIQCPTGTGRCHPYTWWDDGNGAIPADNKWWDVVSTGVSVGGFKRFDVGGTTRLRQTDCCMSKPVLTIFQPPSAPNSGAATEWQILSGTQDAPDIVIGTSASVSGTLNGKAWAPPFNQGLKAVSCAYAFGMEVPGQRYLTAVSRQSGHLEVLGLDSWDNTTIRRKSLSGGAWQPGGQGAAWGLTGPGPAGGFVSSPPAAVALRPDELHVFALGRENGSTYYNALRGSCAPACQTGTWQNIGRSASGKFVRSVAAVRTNANDFHLLALGSDGIAYHKFYGNGVWNPGIQADWEAIGGMNGGGLMSSPVAASFRPDRFDVFAAGSDGKVYHKYFEGGWSTSGPGSRTGNWESVGGLPGGRRIVGELTAVSWGPSRLDIFATGDDGNVYHKYWEGGWGPGGISGDWESIGRTPAGVGIASSPTAVAWGPYRLDIFVTGGDGRVYHKYWRSNWGPGGMNADWELLGGTGQPGIQALLGRPAVVSWGPDRIDVIGASGSEKAYHKAWQGSDWAPGITEIWELISN